MTELGEKKSDAIAAAIQAGEDRLPTLKNQLEYQYQKNLLDNNVEHTRVITELVDHLLCLYGSGWIRIGYKYERKKILNY